MKHALIVGNGMAPPASLLQQEVARCDLFVAADGGGNSCMALGFEPDVVVGDMDSFWQTEYPFIPVVKDDDQETNDLEKALWYVLREGAERVTVLGATGARLDHTLKNLSVMVQFRDRFSQLTFRDGMGWIQLLPRDFVAEVAADTAISLFPLSGRVEGITTDGLAYPLRGESLENGVRDGSSNRATSGTIRITHQTGHLLLMVFDGVY